MFKRWTTLLWIGGGCLGAYLSICNPLVDGAGDTMLRTVCDLFVIGHVLGTNMNERLTGIGVYLGQYYGDEERKSNLTHIYIISMLESYIFESDLRWELSCNFLLFRSHNTE